MNRLLPLNLLAAAAYALTGWLSLQAAIPPDYIAIFFAAAGVGLGAVLVGGYGLLPSVALGSLGVHWLAHGQIGLTAPTWSLWISPLATAAMAGATAWAIRRWAGYPSPLDKPRQALLTFFLIIPAFTVINASVSVPTLVHSGVIAPEDAWFSWTTWWLADTLGAIIFTPLMLVLFGQPAAAWRPRWKTVALPMVVALSLIVGMLSLLNDKQQQQALEAFTTAGDSLARQLQRRLDAQTDSVQAIGKVMEMVRETDQPGFENTTRLWLERYPGSQNFGWSPVIPHSQRWHHENVAPGRTILGRDESGQTDPARVADRYLPITWISPVAGNEAALGLDVSVLPATAQAVRLALDTRTPTVSEPFRLVQETGQQRAVVMYHGVYGGDELLGVVSATLRMRDMLDAALGDVNARGLRVCLVDPFTTADNHTLVGAEGCGENHLSQPLPLWTMQWPVEFGQREWALFVTATPAFWAQSSPIGIWFTGGMGLMATALLGTFLIIVTGHSRRTAQLVEERTQELAHSNATMAQMAHYDALTGLVNRPFWTEQAEATLATASQTGQRVGVIFLDIDRFKHVNDSLGHLQGDQLLVTISARIQECLRSRDVCARIGGDEFVLLLPGLKAPEGAATVAQKILRVLSMPVLMDKMQVRVTASLGVALFPDHGQTVDELLRQADTAMYAAKAAGRNQWRFFFPEMHERVSKRLALESRLRQALEPGHQELHLVYQPQVDAQTAKVVGVEALLRWNHPEIGPISPAEFIPIAEDCGLIEPIGLWVLHQVGQQIAEWNAGPDAALFQGLVVSINVSAYEFSRPHFLDQLRQTVDGLGNSTQVLELEITESLLVQANQDTLERMHAINALGIRLSLDDFGTGYSSLGYLKRMPLSKLKIDRSFLHGIPGDPENEAIVRATLSMAHDLDLLVVAEGVETDGQRDFLRAHGCHLLQGWLYARGLAPADLRHWLQQHPGQRN